MNRETLIGLVEIEGQWPCQDDTLGSVFARLAGRGNLPAPATCRIEWLSAGVSVQADVDHLADELSRVARRLQLQIRNCRGG